MGTKTDDEAGADTGTEAKSDEETVEPSKSEEPAGTGAGTQPEAEAQDAAVTGAASPEAVAQDGDEHAEETAGAAKTPGAGQGAGAVVSAGLGVVSLTGSWVGTVAAARETLIGQLETSSSASVAKQVQEVYGDAWQATALVGGLFALAALIVGVFVLARPAFGVPGAPQPTWIKSVAWAGVVLGVVGLLLSVLKYTDVLLGLPSTG
ncbi:hypothetical protein [Streptomyces minutiscleroticus]|uniref:hypothetical protein n=1 Tax=Streptomyces minutiscleroticus TaxID=68238 RepID=UPI003319B4D1